MARATTPARPASRIPGFASREEEAEFWDTHDITDFLDELTPVRVRFAKKLSEELAVRFDLATLAALRRAAKQRGMAPATLVLLWVLERLEQEGAQP